MDAAPSLGTQPSSSGPGATPRRWYAHPWLWLVLLALAAAYPLARVLHRRLTPPPPVLASLPAFQFLDQQGRRQGTAELRGTVWIANFIFTRCPTICPALTKRMAELQQATRSHGEKLKLVSISVDPEFDQPKVLAEYAARFAADGRRWFFLTGPLEQIKGTVVQGFKVGLERKKPGSDPADLFHGSHFVLVDRASRIRGYYQATDNAPYDALLRDAERLLDE
ncbi:MAG: SCO family protein [Deltaproteobacteria bacterium]|nr:SCO family protein [Deltaproteobacteria bacterium]